MEMMVEMAYGPDALHKFDLYPAPATAPAPLIVFVHGGAWRNEDKSQHVDLARTLVRLTGYPVAVPNYRLTTTQNCLQHPVHASDILRFLSFLTTWSWSTAAERPPSRIYLLGHSCSAHMLASILLSSPFPELSPSKDVLQAVRGVVLSEGIYDVDILLRSFPGYREWFIANTFGDLAAYPDVNVASYPSRAKGEHIRWFVLHSSGDVLVDQLQSEIMFAHLSSIAIEVPVASRVASDSLPRVSKNFYELHEGHNDLLRGEFYPRLVADFIAADAAAS